MPAKQPEINFEDALKRLETLVHSMESGDIPLAELVDKFEEGNKLIKVCQSRLKEAELKIEKMRMEPEGPVAESFDPENNASS